MATRIWRQEYGDRSMAAGVRKSERARKLPGRTVFSRDILLSFRIVYDFFLLNIPSHVSAKSKCDVSQVTSDHRVVPYLNI